jgi:predicted Fe-Mo cluster-binding NifX family protein
MKIALTATSPSIDSEVDPRFGRGAYLIFVDPDTLEWEAHPNPAKDASGGAGTLAAQFVANQHVEAAISGDFGPNAYGALQAAGIEMYLLGTSHTGRDVVEQFKAGKLERIYIPTGSGHRPRG